MTIEGYAGLGGGVSIGRDPNTGRQVTKSAGTDNRKAAEKAAAVWESALRDGRYATAQVDGRRRLLLFTAGSHTPRQLAKTWAHDLTWLPASN